jgi:hypothetical protein
MSPPALGTRATLARERLHRLDADFQVAHRTWGRDMIGLAARTLSGCVVRLSFREPSP